MFIDRVSVFVDRVIFQIAKNGLIFTQRVFFLGSYGCFRLMVP